MLLDRAIEFYRVEHQNKVAKFVESRPEFRLMRAVEKYVETQKKKEEEAQQIQESVPGTTKSLDQIDWRKKRK